MTNHIKLLGFHQKRETAGPRPTVKLARPSPTTSLSPENLLMLQRALESPGSASPQTILTLQRLVGNRAVSSLIQAKSSDGPDRDQTKQQTDRIGVNHIGSLIDGQAHTDSLQRVLDMKVVEALVDKATISEKQKQHILDRHGPESNAPGAGKFYGDWDEIKDLIFETLDRGSVIESTKGPPGYEFEHGFSGLIGVNINGKKTRFVRVKLSTFGNVITAHPI